MADGTFNIAKGKVARYAMLPEADDSLIAVLLNATGLDADDTLNNFDDLAAVLAANPECAFTNYARKTLASVTVTPNDTTNLIDVDAADLVYTSAGGASNETTGKLVVCYKPASASADSAIIPLSHHDLTINTDGSTVTIQFPTDGFWRAQEA